MATNWAQRLLTGIALVGALAGALALPVARAGDAPHAPPTAASLKQRHAEAAEALRGSPFGRPLLLESADEKNTLRGEVLVVIDEPMSRLKQVLESPAAWCEVLMTTPSIAGCRAGAGDSPELSVALARQFDQPAKEAYQGRFAFKPLTRTPEYSALQLTADKGPVGTHDYRFEVDALAIEGGKKSVVRMAYSYGYGMKASLATKAYLATKGSNKVGFTRLPGGTAEAPQYVDGMRGSVERTAMRYFLAIEARTAQTQADPQQRFAGTLDAWLAAIARYPEQLKEADPAGYRRAKLQQFEKAQTGGDDGEAAAPQPE